MKILSGFPFVLLTLLVACGSDNSTQISSLPSTESLNQQQIQRYQQASKPPFFHWGEVEDNLPRYQFDCPDCPASVGQLVAMTVDATQAKPVQITSSCFGGLIAADQFLTSRHCLPDDLQAAEQNCENRIQVILPQTHAGNQIERVDCKKIISLSAPIADLASDEPQPDWAIIQLQHSFPERFTAMDPRPIPDQEELMAFVPLQKQDSADLILQKITCTSRQNSLAVPEYNSDISPIALLDCDQDITKGFSGSLLFKPTDEGYQPVAALSHIHDTQINQEEIIVSQSVVASPFACIPADDDLPDTCAYDPAQHQSLKEQLIIEALRAKNDEIKTRVEQILGDNHPVEWDPIDMNNIEQGDGPAHLLAKWERILNLRSNTVGTATKRAFFETLVQITPRCLRSESRPDRVQGVEVFTQMPLIRLRVQETSSRQISVAFNVVPVAVQIFQDRENPEVYRMGVNRQTPEPPHPPRALFSAGVNHAATSLAVCQ